MSLFIYKNADGSSTWYYRFSRNGKIHQGSTGTSNKALAAKYEDKKKAEVSAAIDATNSKRVALADAFDEYRGAIKHSNEYRNIDGRLRKLLGSRIDSRTKEHVSVFGFDGTRYLDTLTDGDIQRLVIARRNEGFTNGTILTELSSLSQVIKLCKKLGFVVPEVDFASIKKDNKVRPHKGKIRYLTGEEEARLLHQMHPDTVVRGCGSPYVREQRQDAYDLAVVLLDIGGRYSEAARLEWKQVDFKTKSIRLYRSKVANESTLMMTDRVEAVLRRRRAANPNGKYVFEAKNGGPRKYSPRPFNSAIRRAGIDGATIHTIRHTFGTKLAEHEVPAQDIQLLMGHASVTTSMIYVHASQRRAAVKAVDVLNALAK